MIAKCSCAAIILSAGTRVYHIQALYSATSRKRSKSFDCKSLDILLLNRLLDGSIGLLSATEPMFMDKHPIKLFAKKKLIFPYLIAIIFRKIIVARKFLIAVIL